MLKFILFYNKFGYKKGEKHTHTYMYTSTHTKDVQKNTLLGN